MRNYMLICKVVVSLQQLQRRLSCRVAFIGRGNHGIVHYQEIDTTHDIIAVNLV